MKVIHDGDGAYEDVMALSLLLLNCDVVAVTVVYGEANTIAGALNMERVCRALKPLETIPVAYGSNSSIDGLGTPFPEFIHIQADNVLQGTSLPEVVDSQIAASAVELLNHTLNASDEKITIVATGPLTNIAQLLMQYPDSVGKIEKLVIMGGAVNVAGNISDLIVDTENTVAEWNIFADPKAADIVFSSHKIPILLVPLDITSQMPMTRAFYDGLSHEQAPALKLTRDMLTVLYQAIGDVFFSGQLQFWDSLSAMIFLEPTLAEYQALDLRVDLTTGQTIVNYDQTDSSPKIQVAMKLVNNQAAYSAFINFMKTGVSHLMQVSSHQFFLPSISHAPAAALVDDIDFKSTLQPSASSSINPF